MPDKISPSQFAAKIKQKYPDYNGMDDSTLVAKIVEKYPQYKDSIDFGIKTVQEKPVPVPSFREFAASKGLSLEKQRQMAEGTYGPDLAMKAKQDMEVAEAPERKRTRSIIEAARRDEAIVNTTKKKLDSKGVKYTDYDPLFKTELEKTRKDVQDGSLVLTEDNARKPVYKPALGFFESLGYAFKNSVDESIAAAKFDVADNRGKQKIAEEEMKREMEAVPTGFGGKIGEVLGGAAPLIASAEAGASIGTAIAPGAGTIAGIIGSVLATLPDAFSKGRKAEAIKRYNEEVERIKSLKGSITQEDKDQAMNRAMSVGNVAGVAEGAVIAGLSLIAPGSRAAGKGLMSAIKNEAKHAAYDVTRQVGLGIGAEVVKGTAAKVAGYNVSAGDIIEDAVRRGGSDAEMALSFALYHSVKNTPKYVQSAAKNYLSTLPRPELNNMSSVLEGNGVIPKGATEKMNADLDAFNEAKKEFAGMVPEEDMGVFAGLALKKKNLEEKIKSTTLAPVREMLQEELAAVEGRIGKMMESKNPVSEEVNDLSGDTGEGEVLTEERVQETVSNAYKEPVSDIEAKKADIERRRQQELNSIIQSAPIEIYENGKLISTTDKTVEINAKYDKELADLEKPISADIKVVKEVKAPIVETKGESGSEGMVKFAEGVEIPFKYKIIDASELKPSHLPSGERNPEHSIALAQPKERGDIQSKLAQERISKSPNLGEVGESPNPYFGAPVVNKRGEVVQGNNRSLGLKRHYSEGGASYKEQLANNAEKFGLTKEQVNSMENPILVRETPIDDAMAVELGNYDVKDLETGGKQRIDPITTVRKISKVDKNKLASIIFDRDYNTVKEAIRDNPKDVGSIISKYINAAQRNTIFDKEGNINAKGMEDIENIINNMMFESGPAVLPEAFSELSYNAQKNIQKAIKHVFDTPEESSILPDLQNAILGLYDYKKSGIDNFKSWLMTVDIFTGKTPRDIFSDFEIKLMETIDKAKTQSALSNELSKYADLVKGKPADMFEPERAGISKIDAIKQLYNIEYEYVPERYARPEGEARVEEVVPEQKPAEPVGEITKFATPEEQSDFDAFVKREQSRPEFDAEYERERVAGQSKEQYLLRKYCK